MSQRAQTGSGELFIPDFCGIRAVFGVVVLAQILAIAITLVGAGDVASGLDALAFVSLFVQWIALACAALLCLARGLLARLGESVAAACAWLGILGVTAIMSEIAWWIMARAGALGDLVASGHGLFIWRNLALAAIVGALTLRYLYVQHHWRRRVVSESAARIQALQSRMRPHFFFNCMNTIASLTRTSPAAAEQAVEDLADLFRASLADTRTRVPLADELELCRQYLRIEALRLGERLQVDWCIDDVPMGTLVPALSLQPLLENAIYHGVEPSPEGGPIRVAGRREDGRLVLSVENRLPDAERSSPHEGNRIAQVNLLERLEAHYGKAGRLEVSRDRDHYRVTLTFPCETLADAGPDR